MPASRDYPRALRVNEVLRRVVGEELERLADADERLRFLTVTSVEVSADLRVATVFLASMDEDSEAALGERRGQLQRVVGRQVRMKRTPRLQFVVDPALREGARVEEILRRLGSERAERAERAGRAERAERAGRAERAERAGRAERAERAGHEGEPAGPPAPSSDGGKP
jgi:ribosome-binding factor A